MDKKNQWESIIYFILFILLIIAGIAEKRMFNHPERMMLYHGPAAIFLVLAGRKAMERQRRKMLKQYKKFGF